MDIDTANYFSILKILELTIHRDPKIEKELKIKIDSIDECTSFEQVHHIVYRNIIRFFRHAISQYTLYGRATSKVSPHPVYSACLSGGIESRRDTTDGGIKHRPRVITLAFIGNVIDSLMAIKHLCFEKKVCTLKELLATVRNNWNGERGRELRDAALATPYWGDGTDETCGELSWWIRKMNADIDGIANDQGDEYYLGIFIYREFMFWGNATKSTPDGRRNGDILTQEFTPSEYRCKEGYTTVINAIGKLPNQCLYASNANLTFAKTAMTPEILASIFRVYAKKGAHMIQPNCNSVEELIDAQKYPERHKDIIVKVCGFSARFVALSKRWQDEVIARHRLT